MSGGGGAAFREEALLRVGANSLDNFLVFQTEHSTGKDSTLFEMDRL